MVRRLELPFAHPDGFVSGLGRNCANAGFMAHGTLRTCPSPFDWRRSLRKVSMERLDGKELL